MRIAYFVSQYPRGDPTENYFWGGIGVVARELAEKMVQFGHEVSVLTSSPTRISSTRFQRGVRVIEVGSIGTVSQAKIAPALLWAGFRGDFDVLHAHVGNPPAPFGALALHLIRRVPLVITYHGDPQHGYGSAARRAGVMLYEGLPLRLLLTHADVLLLPSLDFARDSTVLPRLRCDFAELPNGVHLRNPSERLPKEVARERLGIPADAKVVLFLGSLNPYKAPDVVLEACQDLARSRGEFVLVFVGDGLMKRELVRNADRMKMADSVRFEGYVAESTKHMYYDAADTLVLPSRLSTEVFPLSVLEAFASGVPVVVSDLRTFARFVHHEKNGLVVKREDAADLRRAIWRLLSDEGLCTRLGTAAFETARAFSWEAIARSAEKTYLRLVRQ